MSKTNKNSLYLIIDKSKLDKRFFKKGKNIFTLNKYILNKFERENINHYFPKPLCVSSKAKSLLLKTSSMLCRVFTQTKLRWMECFYYRWFDEWLSFYNV